MQMLKNSTIYLGSSILNKSIPFLLLPIFTRYLTPSEYGVLSIYLIVISFYDAIIGMSVYNKISKNFFRVSRDELAKIIGNIIYVLSASSTIVLLLTLVISTVWPFIFSIPSSYLIIIPILSFMSAVNMLNLTLLRTEGKAYTYGVFEISVTVLNAGFTVAFLVLFHYGWLSQVWGIAISYFVFCFIGLYYMRNQSYLNLSFDWKKIRAILKLSLPLIPHALGSIVIAVSDRLFIERMVGLDAVAMYAIGYSFGMIVLLFTDAFIKAWSPWFYKQLSDPTDDKKRQIVKYTYIYIAGVFILALLLSVVASFILPLMVTESYYGATEFIVWVALGYAVRGVYQIFFPYLVHISRTAFLGISTVIAALINLGLNYILIVEFGAIGAAYATVVAFAVSALLVFLYQYKNYPMPWKYKWSRSHAE